MLAKTHTRRRNDTFGFDQLEDTLRKYMPEELVALIDEVTAEVEDNPDDGENRPKRQSNKEQTPARFGLASTGNEMVYWVAVSGRIPYPRKSKKSLAIGGLLITILGIAYQYLQAHTDQIITLLQQILQRS